VDGEEYGRLCWLWLVVDGEEDPLATSSDSGWLWLMAKKIHRTPQLWLVVVLEEDP
jgi:hypothetical protein